MMFGRQEISVMILGDHSLCFEHVVRAYYNIKTGRDTKFVLEECESKGVQTTINKSKVDINIRVATTRTGSSRLSMDKIRENDYERRMKDIDVILLCFYQNNSKTLQNVRSKYLQEIKQKFPKIPYFLVGVTIEEMEGSIKKVIKETISIQDRFLKRELDVETRDGKRLAKKIKARGYLECSVLKMVETIGPNAIYFDYDLTQCKSVRDVIDKTVSFALKRKNRSCVIPFRR